MGDTAVVLGGTRGIGAAIAAMLARRGIEVWAVGRSADAPVGGSRGDGPVHAYRGDVRHVHTIARAFREASEAGALRTLVYAAGVAHPEPVIRADGSGGILSGAVSEEFNVNVIGAFTALRLFAETMAPHSGGARTRAVLIASTSALRPSPEWPAYAASKAALVSLGQSFAASVPTCDVITLAPGRTATALRAALAPGEDLASIQQPADVARVLAGLLDEQERAPGRTYIGTPIVVKGIGS